MAPFKCLALLFMLRILLVLVLKYFSKFCGVVRPIAFPLYFEYRSYTY